jgi:hypothetical protein
MNPSRFKATSGVDEPSVPAPSKAAVRLVISVQQGAGEAPRRRWGDIRVGRAQDRKTWTISIVIAKLARRQISSKLPLSRDPMPTDEITCEWVVNPASQETY